MFPSSEHTMEYRSGLTVIQSFYKDSTIFLTGGSGFLGKLLLEKLLRSCYDLKKIYILLREKKGVSPEERLEQILKSPVFEKLKDDNLFKKIVIINGDCEKPNLGLSPDSVESILNEVNCVFHCAATVRFDESIKKATYINVRAVSDLLSLTKKMKNLKAFVHVSTAYANCPRKDIDEIFYEAPMSSENLLKLLDILNDEQLEKLTPILIKNWPNTYVFTKCIAEELVKNEGKGLPLAVVRPTIVVSTSKEPIAGWIDNIYGPTGVLYGAGLGLLHSLRADPKCVSDLVPADYVINIIIASAWEASKNRNSENYICSNEPDTAIIRDEDICIYNYASRPEKPLTWGDFNYLSNKYGAKYYLNLQVWYDFFYFNPNYRIHRLTVICFHFIPGYIVDFFAKLLGRKPMMVKIYKKIDKFSDVIEYFAMGQWNFNNENTKKLWKKLSPEDKRLFEFSMALHNWDTFFNDYVLGGRIYFMKDPIETIPQAIKKRKKLMLLHYCLVSILLYLFCKLIIFFVGIFMK